MNIGTFELILGFFFVVVSGPVVQFVTLRVGANGMKANITRIDKNVTTLVRRDAEKSTDIALNTQSIETLEDRLDRHEENHAV